MTVRRTANAVAARFETFSDYAFAEPEAAPLAVAGLRRLPECRRRFEPARVWQKIYCCVAYRSAGTSQARARAHRAAVPLLVHRIGKYSTAPEAQKRTRSARRYVTRPQSAWVQDRISRAEGKA